ncbi:hypothetical protein LJ655_00875 [Paraburkholderia sp. MMS20-SJTN17]|uniref:Uncharacterized protein n=1 Tax=Paraburkholderia translucens TaxID=2886945 RepID=A0ABS8K6U1_9BURK|nr:hypothetical protein [Paraburkholderia sp. MMS20-SJTN17]MCC8400456.1 hypothetical protein [Paraburkholderia sp. MMS20-SJTN17]
MAYISASFVNGHGSSARYQIFDTARDPYSPPTVYDDFLDPDTSTGSLQIYSDDGIYGNVTYLRSDGYSQVESNITDGSEVRMK